MKRILAVSILLTATATASMSALSFQDDPQAAAEARQAAENARVERKMEQQALKEQKALDSWVENQRRQSESNLKAREQVMKEFRARENELKFEAMQKSAKELLDLSLKTYNRLNASGAQAVSVMFVADLDKMEKLVKDIRKAAK
jgi:DNA-binding SARP family transcriptional activator